MSSLLDEAVEAPQIVLPSAGKKRWRIIPGEIDPEREASALERARLNIGDVVRHVRHAGWEGIVRDRWLEGDGSVWVKVKCCPPTRDREEDAFLSFSTREECLQLLAGQG